MSDKSNEQQQQQQQQEDAPKVEKKITNKQDGVKMAAGYLIGWILFIVIFKLVYGRYRKSQSKTIPIDFAGLILDREPQELVREESGEGGL
jgi:hypothetical protein